MPIRGVHFKWYDGFFLSMLATSIAIVAFNWTRYHLCIYPLHIWIVVDYSVVFIFRLLMFVDNGLAAGMGLDFGWQHRYARFVGRVVVLSILSLVVYPFLWAWTVIGTLWFIKAKNCLLEQGQKWGFLIWLLLSYCGLLCIAFLLGLKWLTRRRELLVREQQGIPVSEFGVLVDMIRVPGWAFEAGQEMRGMGQDDAYHPGLYLTPAQREAVEALIQELLKFKLKAVPTDCTECPICLEEFYVGDESESFHSYDSPPPSLPNNYKLPPPPGYEVAVEREQRGDDHEGVGVERRPSRGDVALIVRRRSKDVMLKRAGLGCRVCEVVFCLVSLSVMVTDKTKGWAGDSYYRYIEYRYCVAVNAVGLIYSGIQACDLTIGSIRGKHIVFHRLRYQFDFAVDQILAYLLISASSSGVTRVDDWVSNWGEDKFTELARVSIVMSFLAFAAFSVSSIISGYNLFM